MYFDRTDDQQQFVAAARDFAAGDERCQQARARHGLPPLAESLAA